MAPPIKIIFSRGGRRLRRILSSLHRLPRQGCRPTARGKTACHHFHHEKRADYETIYVVFSDDLLASHNTLPEGWFATSCFDQIPEFGYSTKPLSSSRSRNHRSRNRYQLAIQS